MAEPHVDDVLLSLQGSAEHACSQAVAEALMLLKCRCLLSWDFICAGMTQESLWLVCIGDSTAVLPQTESLVVGQSVFVTECVQHTQVVSMIASRPRYQGSSSDCD